MITLTKMTAQVQAALKQAKALGAAGAKVGVSCGESISVDFEAGRLKDTGGAQTLGFSVDALVKGRRGQATCGHPDELPRTVERAVALAQLGSVAHFSAWPAPGTVTTVPTYATSTLALTREQLIAGCQSMADAWRAYDADLFISCGARRNLHESLLVTAGGVEHPCQRTSWSLHGHVQRTRGTDMLFAGDGRGWGELNAYFDPGAITEKVLFQLRNAARTVPAPTGKITVFLMPETLGAFLRPLTLGINGRRVAKGESPLAGKLGQRILSEAFTITDDPHRPFSHSAAEIDCDGIPTRRQALVERGVLQRFLYDLDSAGLAKANPTGNNGCSPYSAMVTPGRRQSADLLAGIADGLYLTSNLIGFGQSNIANGDFSCNVGLGYRVQKGEIVGRVKDTMIAGNLYEILAGNVELSADTNYDGSVPHAVVEGVSVSSK